MCGIAGKFYFDQKINRNDEIPLINNTLSKLNHRGPNDEGYFIDENIWIGATRLSILDLSPSGHQPMTCEDHSLYLVFNGEIYNYLELKKKLIKKHQFISNTDSEVILHLYEEYGVECLKYLRGMFAFAIWDKRKKELFLARDRIGKKPIKYFYNDKFFVFASELKAFISHPGIPRKIDWEAIDKFLAYQYVPSPKTGFKNIWKLPPAHYMIVKSNGQLIIKRYWQLNFSHKLDLSEDEWCKLILKKLKESVRLRLRSDVPLGIHLSGGIDSSMITALASMESKRRVRTFSIGFDESNYNELPYAKLVSEKYKTDHHEFILKPTSLELLPELVYQYEEPFADPSILPTYYLMEESKKYITVALNGDGGDENFAGYQRYKVMKLFSLLKLIPCKKILSNLAGVLYKKIKIKDMSILSQILTYPYFDYRLFYQDLISFVDSKTKSSLYTDSFMKKIQSSMANNLLIDRFNEVSSLDKLNQVLYVDINTYLPEVLLTKADISSMAQSLEVRSPFLDHEFIELTWKIPSCFKLNNLHSKYILKKIALNFFPKKFFMRRKQGFLPPLAQWFRTDYLEYLKSQLFDKQFLELGIFNRNTLKQLVEDHVKYRSNNAYALWTILCLKGWLNKWFNL